MKLIAGQEETLVKRTESSPSLASKTSSTLKKKEDMMKYTDDVGTEKTSPDDTVAINKTGGTSSEETNRKTLAVVDVQSDNERQQRQKSGDSTSSYSAFQWPVSRGATSAKIIQPSERHIKVNFKDTIILLGEIRSIVEVQGVFWQKRKEEKWENLNILDEKYKGSRGDLYVPCLIINNCGSEDSGVYRLFVKSSEKCVPSRERNVCVFKGKESAPLDDKLKVQKEIAQFLVLLTVRTFVSCRIKGRFVDFLKSVKSSVEDKLDDEEKEEIEKVLNGTWRIEDLSFGILYKLLQFVLQIDPPARGWNVNPENDKKSQPDDLERCHQYLEQIKSPTISHEKLCIMWNTLTEALHRIIKECDEIHLIVAAFRKMVYWTTVGCTITALMPENILVQNRAQIEGWIEDDLLFEETRASQKARETVRSKPITILIGGRGSGKTFLARHIALEHQLKGWEIVSISSPEEIRRYGDMDKKQMFIQDDAFGVYGIDQAAINKFDTWKEAVLNVLHKCSKYIITCRKTIFLASEIKSILFEYKFDLESDEHCLTNDEKERLLYRHCEEKMVAASVYKNVQLPSLPFVHMFPLLCHLFASNPQDVVSFFNNPFAHLLEEFGMMYERDCKKVDYTSLVLCAVNNGSISMENFPNNDIRTDILDSCGCNLGTPKREIIDSLERMLGTYTKRVGEEILFIHDAIGEVAVCHFGKNNANQVLKRFSITYIVNYVSFSVKPEEDLKFVIEKKHYGLLADRLMEDIRCGKLYEIFMSNIFDYDGFLTTFVAKIKSMDMPRFMTTFIEKIPEDSSFKEKIDLVTSCKAEAHKASEILKHLLIQDTYIENQSENRSIKTISWLVYYARLEILQAVIDRAKDGVLNLLMGTSLEEDARLLVLACYRGSREVLKFLLPYCQENSKNICPLKSNTLDTNFHRFYTPLTAAASLGKNELLQCLMDLRTTTGANINSTDGWGDTPLLAAIRENNLETVKFLVEKLNADINFQASDKVTALYIASEKGQEEIVDYLCSKNAVITKAKSPRHIANRNKHYKIAKKLETYEKKKINFNESV
ncbi:uncharacterized protein LOC133188412 [Saccostrea echinata]|uniref:uncharacterized protein LOC133188412 n=1 Tax=Saccostrea echinata TaxID=191078 RepID=UPI002A809700|nr:uncharacterized protein LOC133188412 [Saccostrea echinata]